MNVGRILLQKISVKLRYVRYLCMYVYLQLGKTRNLTGYACQNNALAIVHTRSTCGWQKMCMSTLATNSSFDVLLLLLLLLQL